MSLILKILLIFLVASCSNASLEDYREEAQGILRSLCKELQAVHTKEDLSSAMPKIKKLFNRLVDVMIAAHEFKIKKGLETPLLSSEDVFLSEKLCGEIMRLYSVEGMRKLIEEGQLDALLRLDAYLQKNQIKGHL